MRSGQDAVIAYSVGAAAASQTYEELAPSFGDYLFYKLTTELKWRSED